MKYTNGIIDVYLFAHHPLMDWVLIGSGEDKDARWITYFEFLKRFKRINI